MTDPKKALKAVHDLIATHNDAAEGYAKAAKGVHDPDLSNWLAAASADREHFAADLTDALEEMGEQSRLDLHEGGILHKAGLIWSSAFAQGNRTCSPKMIPKLSASASPVIPDLWAISITRWLRT
jgi:hypothetical protein